MTPEVALVDGRAHIEGLPEDQAVKGLVHRFTDAIGTVSVGPTIDRSVVGIMVDFAKAVPHYLAPGRWDETSLSDVEARLAETPCFASSALSRCVFPAAKAVELLNAKWPGAPA